MLFLLGAGGFEVFLPRYVAAAAGGEALASLALACVAGFLIATALLKLVRRLGADGLVGYSAAVIGSPMAAAAGAWWALVLVMAAARPLAAVGLVGDVVLGWSALITPPLLFLLTVGCGLAVKLPGVRLARLAEYAAAALLLLDVVVGVTVLDRVDWRNYLSGWDPAAVMRGALFLLGRFCPAYLLLLLMPAAGVAGRRAGVMPGILATAGVAALDVLPAGLYSPGAAAVAFMPSLSLLADSAPGSVPGLFFPAVVLLLLGSLLQTALSLLLAVIVLRGAPGDRGSGLLLAAGAAVAWTGLLFWSNYGGSYDFGATYFPYLILPAALGWPLLLLAASAWARPGEGARAPARVPVSLAAAGAWARRRMETWRMTMKKRGVR